MTRKAIIAALIISGALLCRGNLAEAASFNLSASKNLVKIGDTFSVDVKINSTDTPINAAQATIQFPQDILSITSLDYSRSVFSFWLQLPGFSNEDGQASFIGGSDSGLLGQSLEALKVNFKVIGTGKATINFIDGAATAANGSGTNVLSAMNGISIESTSTQSVSQAEAQPAPPAGQTYIAGLPPSPQISIPFYPVSGEWYDQVSNFNARWPLPNSVTGVAAVLDKSPNTTPSVSQGLFDNENFPPLDDGIWYLHVRFKDNKGWGPVSNYKIAIDTEPPTQLGVIISGGNTTASLSLRIFYVASDALSGVADYVVSIDGNLVTSTVATSIVLPQQLPGSHLLTVVAYDQAGNGTEKTAEFRIREIPFITFDGLIVGPLSFFIGLAVFLLLAWGSWYLIRVKGFLIKNKSKQ
ncbi:MAG: cohesin domain-containing protein [Patescibacteria group bacterium]|nr:cohesin domain-containing protein [Patescibacteria group bacterium]